MQRTVVDSRYELIEPLGSGGMANVYLAHDEVLDRDVAIKLLREQYAGDEEFVGRFRREAQSAARLSHPNIVQIYDWGRSGDGAYYIAMEYVPKGTLKDRISHDGALAPDTAVGVALQVSDALSAAHEHGVVHRDIKPQNILVTRTGDVKVTDFGIARAASSPTVTATNAVLGTAGYMSPEQALGKPVGPGSDLYSLGVILYEMLTGDLPYRAENPIALSMMHVNEPPRSPREANPEVSQALDALTLKLLVKDPEGRYPSAAALTDDLERVRAGLPPASVDTAAPVDAEKTELMTRPLVPPRSDHTAKTTVKPPATRVTPPAAAPGRDARRRRGTIPTLAALLFGALLLGGIVWGLTQMNDETTGDSVPESPEKMELGDGQDSVGGGGFSSDGVVGSNGAVAPDASGVPANGEVQDTGQVGPAQNQNVQNGANGFDPVGAGSGSVDPDGQVSPVQPNDVPQPVPGQNAGNNEEVREAQEDAQENLEETFEGKQ